ncbi:MAG: hypothetical protein ABR878_13015 [Roseiarcus sp.]
MRDEFHDDEHPGLRPNGTRTRRSPFRGFRPRALAAHFCLVVLSFAVKNANFPALDYSISEPTMITPASNDDKGFNALAFAPNGAVSVTDEAMAQARSFWADLQKYDTGTKWVVAFTWASERKYRRSAQSEWLDEGPGIDLCGYKAAELPDGVTESRDGVPVVFIIPRDKIAAASEKKIVEAKSISGAPSFKLV